MMQSTLLTAILKCVLDQLIAALTARVVTDGQMQQGKPWGHTGELQAALTGL